MKVVGKYEDQPYFQYLRKLSSELIELALGNKSYNF
jgi:hypothetical protein